MLPPSLGVLVTPVNPSWFLAARRHPRHRDVVRAGEESGNVTARHLAWGSPHHSRMRRVAAGSQAGDGRGSRGPELPILGPSWGSGLPSLTMELGTNVAGRGDPLSPQTLALGTHVSLMCRVVYPSSSASLAA